MEDYQPPHVGCYRFEIHPFSDSMVLVDSELDEFFGFVKLAGLLFRLDFAHDLLEELDRLGTASAFVTLDVNFDAAIGADADIKFALCHR